MLSFFEMLNLLEGRRKPALPEQTPNVAGFGDQESALAHLKDLATTKPAAPRTRAKKAVVEPAVIAQPSKPTATQSQYSKENPHPNYGKMGYAGFRVPTGKIDPKTGKEVERDMTPEEIQAMVDREKAERMERAARLSKSSSQEKIEEEKRKKALEKFQNAWATFSSEVEGLHSSGTEMQDIIDKSYESFAKLNQAAREYDPTGTSSYSDIETAIDDVLNVGDVDPFKGGEDAKPTSQLSKKEMEKIRKEEEARRRESETNLGATGDLTQGQARFAADFVTLWNDWMKGRTYRVFTKNAIKALGIKPRGPAVVAGALEENSDEYFKIALYTSRDDKSGPDEVIMTAADFLKIKKWVEDNLGFERREDGSVDGTASFRQAISAGMDEDIDLSPVVMRALKLEKHLLSRQVVDKETTVGGLADTLSRLAKTDLVGGLDPVEEVEDLNVAAVAYMISVSQTNKRLKDAFIGSEKRGSGARIFAGKKATVVTPSGPKTRANAGISGETGAEKGRVYQRKFDIFEVAPNADISDPNTKVRVRPPAEIAKIDTRDDNPFTKRNFTYGSAMDRLMSQFGGGKKDAGQGSLPPPTSSGESKPKVNLDDLDLESTDLSDLMSVMEYWNK